LLTADDIRLNIQELKNELSKCVKCGRCLAECPTYTITRREGLSARGKLALLEAELAGEADLARRMKDLLSHCLQCGACGEGCASDVHADELIQAGRALAVKDRGLAGMQGLLARDLMKRGPLTRTALKGRKLFLKNVPPESGLHFRFPLPGLDPERWLPSLAPRPFLDNLPPKHESSAKGPRVALFAGCVANYLHPDTARAAVSVLEAAGARVHVPSAQVCCGKPAFGAGDTETASDLAQKNLAAFNPDEYDYLVAFCATCSEQLKGYHRLEGIEARDEWTDRVKDFSEFLVLMNYPAASHEVSTGKIRSKGEASFGELTPNGGLNGLDWRPETGEGEPVRVFYHDPCHLRRKQNIFEEPRSLLRSLPGVELVGEDLPPACCGYGGLFNLWHYDLSREIFKKRAETFIPLEPDVIVTSCSGCLLQFEDNIHRLGLRQKVSSLAEFIASRVPVDGGKTI
jgi:glycolate oxidase iron-sulfur subunit